MEFTAGGRLEVRITASDLGKRVSVRRLEQTGDDAGRFTDTVGVLTSWDEGVLAITRRTGETVRIAESSLVAGKVVPPAPARRRGPAAGWEELTRIGARAWPPVESAPLGEWTLRASGGFTRRANSALALGSPGVGLDQALERVRAWYAERGLPGYVQLATGAEGTQEARCLDLERLGWRREVSAEVRIGALARVGDLAAPGVERVRVERSFGEGWLARYQRSRTPRPEVRRVLGGGPSVWFATVPDEEAPGGVPAAIGRCVVDGRWAGFMAVEVAPERRREGLATAVMAALARRALDEGASAAWLQVETANEGAHALYAGMGFAVHHHYHHFRSPGSGT
ncbi:GNAT family N-acetyltransferase [Streptomyces sp. NPDC047097]|uniref:GNAT family N-acetyltransferase n=1 Tax=Streptomyces sp. NPDC047097 TaxID=3155260 RepID=UPI0033D6B03B